MKAQSKNNQTAWKAGKRERPKVARVFLDQSEKLRKYKAIPDDFDFLFRTNTAID